MNKLLPIDNVTFWIFFGFWPLWLVWELVLIKLRGIDPNVDLISMVARDRTYQLTVIAFAWGGLAGHFWLNWKTLPWDNPFPAMTFWFLIVLTLIADVILWNHPYSEMPFWARVFRFPGTQLVLGLLNGCFLFPQKGPTSQPF